MKNLNKTQGKNRGLEVKMIGPSKDFESIKKIDENGVEYWTARELMLVLGYSTWRRFEEVIDKAQLSCANSRQFPQDHFAGTDKMITLAKGAIRNITDYNLDRYACYLIAQNGDSSKPAIALAQTYFAVQTRRQEIIDSLSESERRIALCNGIVAHNSSLFGAAEKAGVSKFGVFDDVGYQGLYGMRLSDVEKIKGVEKGELFNQMGSEELGANIFRITQTEAKLKKDNVVGDIQAQATHFNVAKKVRQTMKELGGEMPENLKPEKQIKLSKKERKFIKAFIEKA